MRLLLVCITITTFPALASAQIAPPPSPIESRAHFLAKRVASFENQQDVPSRAFWLSNRVVKKAKEISYKSPQKKTKKRKVL